MEKITRNNYEAFYLDFIEGNLTDAQIKELEQFMLDHEDLAMELDIELNDYQFTADQLSFEEKESLKVKEDDGLITLESVGLMMAKSVEQQLSSIEEVQLQSFIKQHQLEKDYAYFKATKLSPDLGVKYPTKGVLKMREPVIIPLYLKVASAAAVALLCITAGLQFFSEADNRMTEGAMHAEMPTKVNPQDLRATKLPTVDFTIDSAQQVTDKKDKYQDIYELPVNNDLAKAPVKKIKKSQDKERRDEKPNGFSKELENLEKQETEQFEMNPEDHMDDFAVVHPNVAVENEVVNQNKSIESKPKSVVKSEQPFKAITDVAGNAINKEVSFERDKNTASKDYVAYRFKLGNFEFERKNGR
jgi:hypothetical protein